MTCCLQYFFPALHLLHKRYSHGHKGCIENSATQNCRYNNIVIISTILGGLFFFYQNGGHNNVVQHIKLYSLAVTPTFATA